MFRSGFLVNLLIAISTFNGWNLIGGQKYFCTFWSYYLLYVYSRIWYYLVLGMWVRKEKKISDPCNWRQEILWRHSFFKGTSVLLQICARKLNFLDKRKPLTLFRISRFSLHGIYCRKIKMPMLMHDGGCLGRKSKSTIGQYIFFGVHNMSSDFLVLLILFFKKQGIRKTIWK